MLESAVNVETVRSSKIESTTKKSTKKIGKGRMKMSSAKSSASLDPV